MAPDRVEYLGPRGIAEKPLALCCLREGNARGGNAQFRHCGSTFRALARGSLANAELPVNKPRG